MGSFARRQSAVGGRQWGGQAPSGQHGQDAPCISLPTADRRLPPPQWNRILAVRLDNIGDVIMLGPALRAVKTALPDAHLTLLCSPAGAQIAPLLPWVDETRVHRAVWQDASAAMPLDPAREQAFVAQLRDGAYDAALIFTSFSQSPYPPAMACYLAGIPARVGQSREFGGSLLSQWVTPPPDHAHQTDRNLHLVEAVGFPLRGRHLELRLPDAAIRAADDLLASVGIVPETPFALLAPGASAAARRYDPARFAEAARGFIAATGWPVVVVGSARDGERMEPVHALAATHPRVHSFVGQTDVPTLAALIGRAGIVLANDSGPMHIADALRRPMVILYSGTERESQWQPRSAPATLLREPTHCAPCHRFTCPYHMECLDIAPERVVAAALALLTAQAAVGDQSAVGSRQSAVGKAPHSTAARSLHFTADRRPPTAD